VSTVGWLGWVSVWGRPLVSPTPIGFVGLGVAYLLLLAMHMAVATTTIMMTLVMMMMMTLAFLIGALFPAHFILSGCDGWRGVGFAPFDDLLSSSSSLSLSLSLSRCQVVYVMVTDVLARLLECCSSEEALYPLLRVDAKRKWEVGHFLFSVS